jgi:hypothetical protein
MTYGENYVRPSGSIHAEQDCINKLPGIKRQKRLKKISILSIRVNRLGGLANAKPCWRCIYTMSKYAESKGYKIATVYYSDSCGDIMECSLDELCNEDCKHVSSLYRPRNVQ